MKIDRKAFKGILNEKDIDQQVIADLLKLNKATLSQRLNNRSKFSEEQIKLISDFLTVEPANFIITTFESTPPKKDALPNLLVPEVEVMLLKSKLEDSNNEISRLRKQIDGYIENETFFRKQISFLTSQIEKDEQKERKSG